MLGMQRPPGETGTARLVERTIHKLLNQEGVPTSEKQEMITQLKAAWRTAATGRKETKEAVAHSRLEAEGRCAKRFWVRSFKFKHQHERREIQELFPMQQTDIELGVSLVTFINESINEATSY